MQPYVSQFDINKQAFWPVLYQKYGKQGIEFVGMCEAMGWTSDISVELIQHFEDDWIWDNFSVEAQAGGGLTATLTISASSIDAQGNFYPGVKDIIEFPNKDAQGNYIQAYVTAIGANTIDVKAGRSTWLIPATTAGETLFIATNVNGEGTGQPAPKVTTFNKYTNTVADIKQTVGWTGAEALNDFWFDEYDGKTINGAVGLASMQLDFRMAKTTQGMILSGQKYQNLTDGGKLVTGTEGLFPALNRAAIPFGYTTWGLSSYDVIEKALSKVYAGTTTGMLLARDLDITNENVIADWLKHTNVDYVRTTNNKMLFGENDNSEDLAVAIGFDYIKKAKRDFGFMRFSAMTDPKTYGTDGFDYTRIGIGFPLKANNMDAKTKAKIPAMRTIYKKKDGFSGTREMFWTGSSNAAKYGNTNDIDTRELNCRTKVGFEVFGVNQFAHFFPN
ncbi:MAG TPA: hypothetical protein VK590_06200 [Saprospiraceae bacterium]|nr:hypothetical protein [Saprospiraceae bacterium]